MRRPLVKFSESEASNHTPSLADFTTTTPELKFSVHTSICFPLCPRTRTWLDAVGMSQTCKIWKSLTFNRQAVALGHQWRRERPSHLSDNHQSPQRQSRVYSTKRKSNLALRSGERA